MKEWRVATALELPDYLVDRVLAPAPGDCGVLHLSTPVVAFGNARVARVATLGLNPSGVEFLDKVGHELVDPHRRLATRNSLGRLADDRFSVDDARRIVTACDSYFTHNPYRRWFNHLERILNEVGASYWPGMTPACHLDVSQWSTDPVWGKLRSDQRRHLVMDGLSFLQAQLQRHSIELLLVNGSGAMAPIRSDLQGIDTQNFDRGTLTVGVLGDVRVVGWSTNLQSSRAVTNDFRGRLANRVKSARR